MRITLFVLFLTLSFFSANASITNPMYGCDTLITTSGQVLLVQLESSSTDSILKFRYCGDSAGNIVEKNASFAREIRRAPKRIDIPEGAEQLRGDEILPQGTQIKDLAKEERQISINAKLAALFGVGGLFLWFFAIVFSPWVGLLILPFLISGFAYSIKTMRRTKRKPQYRKQRNLGILGLTCSILHVAGFVLYIFLLILFLLLLF